MVELGALRHTPAGVAVIEFRLRHESRQIELGSERTVTAELDAIAFEAQANLVSGISLESALKVEGFLCAKSWRSKRPVLHVTTVEFIEGD